MTRKKLFLNIILGILVFLVIFISFLIWSMTFSYTKETSVYENAKNEILLSEPASSSVPVLEESVTEEGEQAEFEDFLNIDFEALAEMCPAAIAWLDIPGTNISYPIVQGTDNNFYLSYDAYGNASSLGAIYLNCNNAKDFSDYKSIVYGHNMRNGTMFHDLSYYGKLSYALEHMNAYLYFPDGTIKIYTFITSGLADSLDLRIYALRKEDSVSSTLEYFSFLSDSSTNIYTKRNLLILSTCSTNGEKNTRRVVIFQEL